MGGIVELAPGYLSAVYSTIKKAGGLFISDEVQSGFARTGSHFWGFESHGVVPDIVTMAKVGYNVSFYLYIIASTHLESALHGMVSSTLFTTLLC